MAKRELNGDSEEVKAAIADLQGKVAAKNAESEEEAYGEEAYEEEAYEEEEQIQEEEIAVKNFEDRINDTVRLGNVGDLINGAEEDLEEQERYEEEIEAEERRQRREMRRRSRMENLKKERAAQESREAEKPAPLRKRNKKYKPDDDVIIELEGVSKSYVKGVPALNDVNLKIRKGEFVFIVGDSGSGKSTLIRLLLRELKPTTGSIWVNGFQVEKLRRGKVPKLRRSMGVVFQDFRLLKDRNVYENVAFAQRIIQIPTREMKRNVPNILATVGLAGKYKARPDELSGGEQQRVALARALVNKPPILLADEPTGNLDPKNTIEIMNLLDTINKNGTTVLVVTHNDKIVNDMQKRVITIKNGVIVSDEEMGGYLDED